LPFVFSFLPPPPPAQHVNMKGEGSLVDGYLMALKNFTEGGVYLIECSMFVVSPP